MRLPYLAESEFWLAARAVDACINLRYPAAGESSGIAVRMMGIGKPVLLTEGLESAAFPGRRLRPDPIRPRGTGLAAGTTWFC